MIKLLDSDSVDDDQKVRRVSRRLPVVFICFIGDPEKATSMKKITTSRKGSRLEEEQGSIIVLIEPRSLTRQCLSAWLEHNGDGADLRALATPVATFDGQDQSEAIDLVIWSIGSSSIASDRNLDDLERLKQRFPETPLVVLADRDDPADVAEAVRRGVRGYVPTSLGRHDVWEVLRFVRAGGTYFPASALIDTADVQESSGSPCSSRSRARPMADLTPRELDVVEQLRQGKPNKVIAHELQITESTVKVFVHRILTKLGAVNRTEVAYLVQQRAD